MIKRAGSAARNLCGTGVEFKVGSFRNNACNSLWLSALSAAPMPRGRLLAAAALSALAFGDGNWNVDANWTNPATFPNGADAVADFSTLNITANRTVTLGQNITVGSMTVGDSNSTHTYTITGSTLTFDVTSGTASLTSVGDIGTTLVTSFLAIGTGDTLEVQVNGTGGIRFGGKNIVALTGKTIRNSEAGSGVLQFGSTGTGTDIAFTGGNLVQDSLTSAMVIGANTNGEMGGGTATLTVRRGLARYGTNRPDILGTTNITLGDSAGGSDNATLRYDSNNGSVGTISNPLRLAANTTGVLTLQNESLDRVFSGGVAGTNSLTIENRGTQNITFGTAPINNTGAITHSGAGSGLLTINSVIGANVTGVIQNSATSRMVLLGTNTYSGATTISAGTLTVGSTGSIANSSLINVQSGGVFNVAAVTGGFALSANQTLAGTGTVTGSVGLTSLTSVLSPGNSPGILPFGTSQSWNSFTYDWESNDWTGTVAGTAFDQIAITGGLTLSPSGSYQLDLLSLTAGNISGTIPNYVDQDRTWTIVSTTAGITGFDASKWNIVTTGFTGVTGTSGRTFSVQQTGNSIELVYAVPEPATLGLAAAVGLLAAAGVARRRARA
jgi:hypothetical protein